MILIRHVVIRGRVQGVGYRAFVEDEAARISIEGWVRNRRDGTVEAVFAGDPKPSRTSSRLAARALTRARVDGIDVREADAEELALRGAKTVRGAADRVGAFQDRAVGPNSASNSRRIAMSTSAMPTGRPRSARLVTP